MITSLEGFPKPTLKIFKDGKDITVDETLKVEYEEGKIILLIKKTTLESTGKYRVDATNEVGTDTVEGLLNIIGKISNMVK